MTTALTQPQATERRGDGLQPTSFVRDLRQIADLVELCFEPHLDAGGRSAVGEMRALSYIWPLIWLLILVDHWMPGLGTGYVWRAQGRVIGNVSLYRAGKHPEFGPGFLIANVAVHPDSRRQGIARALVEKALDMAHRNGARWIALQVEADNIGANRLYEGMGFTPYETLSLWENYSYFEPSAPAPEAFWPDEIHMRQPAETGAEADLIFHRARRGAMVWTHPIERRDIWDGMFDSLDGFFRAMPKEHWLLADPANPNRLIGTLWVENSGWRHARLSQFLDPAITDPEQRQSLLRAVLGRVALDGWSIRIETNADDPVMDTFLTGRNFQKTRSLTQMRLML